MNATWFCIMTRLHVMIYMAFDSLLYDSIPKFDTAPGLKIAIEMWFVTGFWEEDACVFLINTSIKGYFVSRPYAC